MTNKRSTNSDAEIRLYSEKRVKDKLIASALLKYADADRKNALPTILENYYSDRPTKLREYVRADIAQMASSSYRDIKKTKEIEREDILHISHLVSDEAQSLYELYSRMLDEAIPNMPRLQRIFNDSYNDLKRLTRVTNTDVNYLMNLSDSEIDMLMGNSIAHQAAQILHAHRREAGERFADADVAVHHYPDGRVALEVSTSGICDDGTIPNHATNVESLVKPFLKPITMPIDELHGNEECPQYVVPHVERAQTNDKTGALITVIFESTEQLVSALNTLAPRESLRIKVDARHGGAILDEEPPYARPVPAASGWKMRTTSTKEKTMGSAHR